MGFPGRTVDTAREIATHPQPKATDIPVRWMSGFKDLNAVSVPEAQMGLPGRTVDTAHEMATHPQPLLA